MNLTALSVIFVFTSEWNRLESIKNLGKSKGWMCQHRANGTPWFHFDLAGDGCNTALRDIHQMGNNSLICRNFTSKKGKVGKVT